MPAVKLPFLLEGKEVRFEVYVEDIEAYEDAERKAVEAKRFSAMVRARADWVQGILGKSPDLKGDVRLKMTTDQVDQAFWAIWRGAQGRGPDPLE